MVIQQPNSLPDDVKPKPHDADSAATDLKRWPRLSEQARGLDKWIAAG